VPLRGAADLPERGARTRPGPAWTPEAGDGALLRRGIPARTAEREPELRYGCDPTMTALHRLLLAFDGAVDLVLGSALLLFPAGVARSVGLPPTDASFYSSVLGAVVFGIGISLLLDLRETHQGTGGLGLAEASVINFCAGGALGAWLLFGRLNVPRSLSE
jgi:hypothetical protein